MDYLDYMLILFRNLLMIIRIYRFIDRFYHVINIHIYHDIIDLLLCLYHVMPKYIYDGYISYMIGDRYCLNIINVIYYYY